MAGLGTIINTIAVIIGGLLGMIFGKGLKQRFQDALMMASSVCVLFIGISGTMQEMLALADGKLTTVGTMMMIGSFTFGSLVGEWLNIEHRMEQFGEWLKAKSGNSGDGGFVNGFVTCSLTICIGAMAVVGSIQDGILGDHSTLMAKAVLDLIIVMIMTASMGKGCIFSAIPIAVFQGTITLLARLIEPIMTEAALANLSLTGSIMIFCVGLNLIWGKKVKVANMLPTLVFAVAWSFLPIGA
ncbi:MAG: DUF554 domain-containing protein [Clostridia bacterium]|nr:DUF554 domain-containing protein [Clostridia bacterium]MDO4356194.1 DUF554 domain-containing protein [Clostridia bacterium]